MTPPDSKAATRSAVHRDSRPRATRIKRTVSLVICATVIIGAAVTVTVVRPWANRSLHSTQWVRYLGVYQPDAPSSYTDVNQFARAIGRQPNLVSYYSPWLEPFQMRFATEAAKHGATTLVQIDPKNISLRSIATGRYDAYLRSYAAAVKSFGGHVVLSFGHEMNGNWYSWAYQHTPAQVFVAAWRHIVTVFRKAGSTSVTWLWTTNIIDTQDNHIPSPARWWPGSAYVTWVGIDGYYHSSSDSFAQVFGPTIVDVRALSPDPILISETGASLAAGQSAKITDVFSGIRTYGLLGFVWFDANSTDASNGTTQRWRLTTPAALSAFRRNSKAFVRPQPSSKLLHPSAGSSSP